MKTKTNFFLNITFLLSGLLLSAQYNIELVKDINPLGNASIEGITEYNGKLYFSADDGVHGRELWTTDGTADGTELVKDIREPGVAHSIPSEFTEYNGKLYFRAHDGAVSGIELWATDGTTDGTELVKDIYPGPYHSLPERFHVYNDRIYFKAQTYGTSGNELWVSDGTAAGTQMFKDINLVDGGGSGPSDFTELNGLLYFVAEDFTASLQPVCHRHVLICYYTALHPGKPSLAAPMLSHPKKLFQHNFSPTGFLKPMI